MAVTGTYAPVREAGNGSKVDFDFTFKILATSELNVGKILNSTGVKTDMVLGVDYTAVINATTDGGTVTYMVAPTALQDSWIGLDVAITQTQDIPTNNIFREVQVENALDKLTLIAQQQQNAIDRAIKLDETSIATITLPSPVDDNLLAWDGTTGLIKNMPATDFVGATGPTGATGPAGANGIFSAIASQAEAEAGADNTKGMSPLRSAQAIAALGSNKIKLMAVDVDVALTTDLVVSGVGFTPKAVIAFINLTGGIETSWGMADASTKGCVYLSTTTAWGHQDSYLYFTQNTGGTTQFHGVVASFDADGVTITRTKFGSPTGTARLILMCFG